MDRVCGAFDGGGESAWGGHIGDEGKGEEGEVGLYGGCGADLGFLGGLADSDADGMVGAEGDEEGAVADVAGCAAEEDEGFGRHGCGEGAWANVWWVSLGVVLVVREKRVRLQFGCFSGADGDFIT